MSIAPVKVKSADSHQMVEEAVKCYQERSHAPGLCVAIYDEAHFGTAGLVFPYGLSGPPGLGTPPPVTGDTAFQVGSVTKVFTSTLLAYAVGSGVASLNDTLVHWLNFDHTFSPDPIGSEALGYITLGELATQTSGMPGDEPSDTKPSEKVLHDELPPHSLMTSSSPSQSASGSPC